MKASYQLNLISTKKRKPDKFQNEINILEIFNFKEFVPFFLFDYLKSLV